MPVKIAVPYLAVCLAGFAWPSRLVAQDVHLLCGCQDKSSTKPARFQVVRIDESTKRLSFVRDLEAERWGGVKFLLTSHDHRVFVAAMPIVDATRFLILDMDNIGRVEWKQDDFTQVAGAEWSPHSRPQDYLARLRPHAVTGELVWRPHFGLILDLTISGKEGFADYGIPLRHNPWPRGRPVPRSERAGLTWNGTHGLGVCSENAGQGGSIEGTNFQMIAHPLRLGLGMRGPDLPDSLRALGQRLYWEMIVHNSHMLAVVPSRNPEAEVGGDGGSYVYVYNKLTSQWRRVAVPGSRPLCRGIGRFILGIAATPDPKNERRSAGAQAFLDIVTKLRPEDGIKGSGIIGSRTYYPGIIFAIDVDSGQLFQLRTGQGDSEPLWVDDAWLYYRVANELFKAPFVTGAGGKTLGPPVSVVKADLILDAHWGFRGR